MSQENVEIVRRGFEAAVAHPPDWSTVNAVFDRNHELIAPVGTVDMPAPRVGGMGFNDLRAMLDQTGDWRLEVEDVRGTPDGRVVVLLRFGLTGQRSGAHVVHKPCLLCTVENDRITRSQGFDSWDDALKAVDLEE